MTGLDYFAWLVLIVILASGIALFVFLAMLPGKIAKGRNHPQADAINVAGWLGIVLTLGVVWVLALIWAFTKQDTETGGDGSKALKVRVAALEARLNSPEGAAR